MCKSERSLSSCDSFIFLLFHFYIFYYPTDCLNVMPLFWLWLVHIHGLTRVGAAAPQFCPLQWPAHSGTRGTVWKIKFLQLVHCGVFLCDFSFFESIGEKKIISCFVSVFWHCVQFFFFSLGTPLCLAPPPHPSPSTRLHDKVIFFFFNPAVSFIADCCYR